mgnify:CR=1 FL=1
MTEHKDWKADYTELLQQHERQAATHAELEQLLTRTVIRLTLAASGLDGKLDSHLKRIRDAVRKGADPRLSEQLNRLSDELMHLSEDEEVETPDISDICGRLVSRLSLSSADALNASKLLAELLDNPAQISDPALDQLAALLNRAPGPEKRGPGLLGRIFSAEQRTAGQSSTPTPNEILLNLLEQASWPGHWGTDISQMKASLSTSPAEDAWVGVLQDLLPLSARSYGEAQSEIEEAGSFLEELTRRLQDLDEHLRYAHDGREEVVGYGRRFSDQVSAQVDGLESSVSEAVDLHQLKTVVSERLNAITQTMEEFLRDERQWFQKNEDNEQELRERLKVLEEESTDLRFRMLEAHHMALQDAVTGLPNRMAYDERIEQEHARWKRFGEPLTLLVWDVDNFKSINDRFGHQAGDKALRIIAESLRKRLRETDFIARYGGEEFVTLLSGAEQKMALKVADEMRQGVMNCGFHSKNRAIPVTISCGISCFSEGDTVAAVFARADKALYEAKRKGKNRCEMA